MKPKGLAAKAFQVVRRRPADAVARLRDYALFLCTRLLLPVFGPDPGLVELGRGVRLQRLRCILAEKPDARISVGERSIIHEHTRLEASGRGAIKIGPSSVLGGAKIMSRFGVKIGSRFLCSWNVLILDFDPHPVDPAMRRLQVEEICADFHPSWAPAPAADDFEWDFPGEAVSIGDDCWVGANATILKGARIGNGCIVGAGAVVLAGAYPDRSVIAGNPARVVKTV